MPHWSGPARQGGGWEEPGAREKLGTALPLPVKWGQDLPSPGCPQQGGKKGQEGWEAVAGTPQPTRGTWFGLSVPSARGQGRAEGPWMAPGALQKFSSSVGLDTG